MRADEFGTLLLDDNGRPAVRFARPYAAAPARLWAALTEPGQLARWFEATGGDLRAGGTFAIRFPGDPPYEKTGRILRCARGRSFTITWIDPPHPEARLCVELCQDGDNTTLALAHGPLPRELAADYGLGWHSYLDRLAAFLGGGAATDRGGQARLLAHYAAQAAALALPAPSG
jgi:uncharacterized protein YndB with AHSA1/START domain